MGGRHGRLSLILLLLLMYRVLVAGQEKILYLFIVSLEIKYLKIASVVEWSITTDCKSVAHRATQVRILPGAPEWNLMVM